MKKILIFVLAAILVIGIFAGCSANGYIDTPDTYGNVSTTRDGRVNGTNRTVSPVRRNTNGSNGSATQFGMDIR